jgi:HEAT repeat protein
VLGEIKDPRAVVPLIAALKDANDTFQNTAVEALGKLEAPAVEPLIAALKDTDVKVQKLAASALGEIKDPRAVEPLIGALKDTNWEVRQSAAGALWEIKDPRAVEPLIAALKDADQRVRGDVDKALEGIGAPAVEPLIATLKKTDSRVRMYAARALGKIKDPRSDSALLAAWSERDMAVIAGAGSFFIGRGESGSENTLIEALNSSGDRELAQDFLNCRNPNLADAAHAWATRNGYSISWIGPDLSGSTYAKWGSEQ